VTDPTVNLVKAAYEPVVARMLRQDALIARYFPRTPQDEERRREAEDREMRRRDTLMRDHLTEPGTTSVCRCGHVGYSTPGYLLHLYEVIAADATRYCGDC
jgi:hypothetical protein